jgi:hypothetical protein
VVEAAARPNRRYYSTVRGPWTATFEFDVVDWGVFWSRPMGLIDRVRVIGMVVSRAILGRPRIDTRVEFDETGGAVRHELRVSKWGVPFFHSRETITLHEDGRGLTVAGEGRMFPLMIPADLGEAGGEIDDSGTQARYSMQWMGGPMEIRTQLVDGGADIEMDAGWGRGVQRLRSPH